MERFPWHSFHLKLYDWWPVRTSADISDGVGSIPTVIITFAICLSMGVVSMTRYIFQWDLSPSIDITYMYFPMLRFYMRVMRVSWPFSKHSDQNVFKLHSMSRYKSRTMIPMIAGRGVCFARRTVWHRKQTCHTFHEPVFGFCGT